MSAGVRHTVRMLVPAAKASPSPPVGPTLGQRGIKAIDFCKAFNDKTRKYVPGTPMQVRMKVNSDKTYDFIVCPPPTSWLLKQAAGIEKGATKPGHDSPACISVKHIYEIAKIKAADPAFDGASLRQICKKILGSAKSMGIEVVY